MDESQLWFVLLLPLHLCLDSEESVVKTIGRQADVTPICTTATMHIITFIVCKIRTEMSSGKECRLLYHYELGFMHECDPRFSLITENQTVFLHLTNLTPVDSGNYTCECSHARGTDTLHLILSVKGDEETNTSYEYPRMKKIISTAVIGCGTGFIIVAVVVLWLILRKNCCREQTRPDPSGLSDCEASPSLAKDDTDNLYSSLQQPASDLYQTISSVHHQHVGNPNSASNNTADAHLEQETGRDNDQNVYQII